MPRLVHPQSLCLGCAPCLIFTRLASFCHSDLGSKVPSSEIPPLPTDSTMPLLHILFITFITLCKYFLYLLVNLFVACSPPPIRMAASQEQGFLLCSLLYPLCQEQYLTHSWCLINMCRMNECVLCPHSDYSLSSPILRTCPL